MLAPLSKWTRSCFKNPIWGWGQVDCQEIVILMVPVSLAKLKGKTKFGFAHPIGFGETREFIFCDCSNQPFDIINWILFKLNILRMVTAYQKILTFVSSTLKTCLNEAITSGSISHLIGTLSRVNRMQWCSCDFDAFS